jgi:uncharacterized damage-inducible protein DinB
MEIGRTISEFLDGGLAYTSIKKAITGIQTKNRFTRPDGAPHSIYEELEHMRIAQEDILRYTLDPEWKSPDWPGGYWPDPHKRHDAAAWTSCIKGFWADLDECKAMAQNQEIELTTEIPHGEGRTYLRQLLLVAEHNSYHLGQIVLIRKLLKDWTE